jgi:hypothetical protein
VGVFYFGSGVAQAAPTFDERIPMTMFGRAMSFAVLAGAVALAGFGDGDNNQLQNQQAGQGSAVGDPNGGAQAGAPVAGDFIQMAQQASCADVKNRLFLIDGKQVFWDRAGKCADNAYGQRLFGATVDQLLCSVTDSIAGPQTFCADDTSGALLDTIRRHLDMADLGLVGHKVEPLSFLPKSGTAIGFQSLVSDTMSGVSTAKTVVLRDSASFAILWAEHGSNRLPAPDMPQVDFIHQMVLAVFAGPKPNACHAISIVRVGSDNGRMVVDYDEHELVTVAPCAAVVSTPAHMVVVERSDAPVEFVQTKAGPVEFQTIDQTTRSGVREARNVVVRDTPSWAALWSAHAGSGAALPTVDFSRQMVVGVFLGTQANGCYATKISNVAQNFGAARRHRTRTRRAVHPGADHAGTPDRARP